MTDAPSILLTISATVLAVFLIVGGMAWVMAKQ